MSNQTKAITGEGNAPRVTGFAYYKGHVIDVEGTGHPQAQNIIIDGKPVGYVVFPTPAIATAKGIIDQRDELKLKLEQRDKDYLGCFEIREQYKAQRDELLAACKSVVDTWEQNFKGQETGYEGTALESDYKLCKAAITKAERK